MPRYALDPNVGQSGATFHRILPHCRHIHWIGSFLWTHAGPYKLRLTPSHLAFSQDVQAIFFITAVNNTVAPVRGAILTLHLVVVVFAHFLCLHDELTC